MALFVPDLSVLIFLSLPQFCLSNLIILVIPYLMLALHVQQVLFGLPIITLSALSVLI